VATFKLTLKRGQKKEDVVKAAGSAIAGSDALELNVDATVLTKGELLTMLDVLQQQIAQKGFPQ
jgi:hypothetical protein